MEKETNSIGSAGSAPKDTAGEGGEQLLHSIGEEEIRCRAYEIYLERGAHPGHEWDDWLQAERELNHNRPTETAKQH
jgi:hypothetical protein